MPFKPPSGWGLMSGQSSTAVPLNAGGSPSPGNPGGGPGGGYYVFHFILWLLSFIWAEKPPPVEVVTYVVKLPESQWPSIIPQCILAAVAVCFLLLTLYTCWRVKKIGMQLRTDAGSGLDDIKDALERQKDDILNRLRDISTPQPGSSSYFGVPVTGTTYFFQRMSQNIRRNLGWDRLAIPDLLTPVEIEAFVSSLEISEITELGSFKWLEKHDRVKKLTIQSVLQALSNKEETVKDFAITHEKLPILVHDVVMGRLWREIIFPELLEDAKGSPTSSLTIYPILYHESVALNLLKTLLYHPSAMETLGDTALDLADYCLHNLAVFLSRVDPEDEVVGDPFAILNQADQIFTGISIKCLSLLRYIIQNIDDLGNGIVSRLIVSTDTPMTLTELIVQKPWRREYWKTGKILDFDLSSNQWKEIDPSARMLLSDTEIQVWLSLYLLFKNNRILAAYELYESRKNNLLKLRPYLNEVTLEQLPLLGEFQAFLNQLSILTSGPFGPSKSSLLLEMVPPIGAELEERFQKEKKTLVAAFRKEFIIGASRDIMMERAKVLTAVYDLESFESALPASHPCASCGKNAVKKCSRCQEIWYCSRECQVKDWKPRHKQECQNKS